MTSTMCNQIKLYLSDNNIASDKIQIKIYISNELKSALSENETPENYYLNERRKDNSKECILYITDFDLENADENLYNADLEPDYILSSEELGNTLSDSALQHLLYSAKIKLVNINSARESKLKAIPNVLTILQDIDNFISCKDIKSLVFSLAKNLPYIRQYLADSKMLESAFSKSGVDSRILQNRISSLEELVNLSATQIKERDKTVLKLEQALKDKDESTLNMLNNQLKEKDATIQSLYGEINKIRTEVQQEASTKSEELEAQLKDLSQQKKEAEDNLESVRVQKEEELSQLKMKFDAAESNYINTITGLQQKMLDYDENLNLISSLQSQLADTVSKEKYETLLFERDQLESQLMSTSSSSQETNFFVNSGSHGELVQGLINKINKLQDKYKFTEESLPVITPQTEGLPANIKVFKELVPSKHTYDFITALRFDIQTNKSNTFILIFDPLSSNIVKSKYVQQGLNVFDSPMNFLYISSNADIKKIFSQVNFRNYKNLVIIDRTCILKDVADIDFASYYFLVDDPDVMKTEKLDPHNCVVFYEITDKTKEKYAGILPPAQGDMTFMERTAMFRSYKCEDGTSLISKLLNFGGY